MDRIVECVPNISEGRNPETVNALVDAIRSVPGVIFLDRQSDPDHHRTVLTFAGAPEAVAEAAFLGAREALRRIDLTIHRGEHPRVGATDVIPLVPIRGVTMEECISLARSLGRRVADELRIPVFLYEQAATVPFRTRIEDIRRGGLDELAERMRLEPKWAPDFGDAKMHRTAGATIIGARRPLIAFNVNLASNKLDLAKAIATRVRGSDGGLPSVKALGIPLKRRGLVQVTMNLTNYEETPVHVAFEAVKAEAAKHGISVHSSELVGLIPEAAAAQIVRHYLQFEHFEPDEVLEARLAQAQAQDLSLTVAPFLEAVSTPAAGPGGGSVAAMVSGAAIALGLMVSSILIKEEKDLPRASALRKLRDQLMQLRRQLEIAVREDAEAYANVIAAHKRPTVDPNKSAAISEAINFAIAVPLAITEWTVSGIELLRELIPFAPAHLAADLRVGVLLGQAAGEAALTIIKTNLESLKDDPRVPTLLAQLATFESRLRGKP